MSVTPINIFRGATRVGIQMAPTHPAINYIRNVTRRTLTDYDFNPWTRTFVPVRKYLRYENKTETLYVPINLLTDCLHALNESGTSYVIQDEAFTPARDLTIKMKSSFVPREHQVPAIEYLKQPEPYRKGLAIQTGSGKTVSSLAGLIAYGKVGMISVSHLHQQWVRSIFEFTTATEAQVAIIQGYHSLVQLMAAETKPELFVFSLETLRAFCRHTGNYADLPTFEEFIKYFGIGSKIFDEVHLNFHACTVIDLSCNLPNNIYLTATFTSGNSATRRIFNRVYPLDMQFGRNNIKRYTTAYLYDYYGNVPERACMRARGYMQNKYEQYLTKRPSLLKDFFEYVLQPILNSHYVNIRNPGEKVAIFANTLEMVSAIAKWCREHHPGVKVVEYIGGTPDKVLVDNEIIVTTPKSCGCGTDIKNLRAVINLVSTKAPTAVQQCFGRLREIPGVETQYADVCDRQLPAQLRHQEERIGILQPIAKAIKLIRI